MQKWLKSLQRSTYKVEELAEKFKIPLEDLKKLEKSFKFRITPYYMSLIKEKGDAIYKQCVPDLRELEGNENLMSDPLGEEKTSPVHNIVHRYPDRCLFLVSNSCAMYCRFCTRKRKFGDCSSKINESYIDEGIEYIRNHTEIRDVVISGGDPFLLTDDKIEYILKNLRQIPHLQILRIGTRTPCVLPERITTDLTKMLKKYHPLFINVHFNHPNELTPQSTAALGKLADAGIPLGSQTVLLKGVNDDPEIMKLLMHKLLMARVKPYYIYQADMVFGSEHFRTTVKKGLEIIQALRGWTSGLAVPHYVIDAPDGGGKIPLLPEYVQEIRDDAVVMKNYRGKTYTYEQIEPEEQPAVAAASLASADAETCRYSVIDSVAADMAAFNWDQSLDNIKDILAADASVPVKKKKGKSSENEHPELFALHA